MFKSKNKLTKTMIEKMRILKQNKKKKKNKKYLISS